MQFNQAEDWSVTMSLYVFLINIFPCNLPWGSNVSFGLFYLVQVWYIKGAMYHFWDNVCVTV